MRAIRANSERARGAEERSSQLIGCVMALVAAHVQEVRLQIGQYRFQSGWRHAFDEPLEDMIPVGRRVERFEACVAPKRAQNCP